MMPHASPTSVIILWCPNIELVSNMYHGPSKHAAIPLNNGHYLCILVICYLLNAHARSAFNKNIPDVPKVFLLPSSRVNPLTAAGKRNTNQQKIVGDIGDTSQLNFPTAE